MGKQGEDAGDSGEVGSRGGGGKGCNSRYILRTETAGLVME